MRAKFPILLIGGLSVQKHTPNECHSVSDMQVIKAKKHEYSELI